MNEVLAEALHEAHVVDFRRRNAIAVNVRAFYFHVLGSTGGEWSTASNDQVGHLLRWCRTPLRVLNTLTDSDENEFLEDIEEFLVRAELHLSLGNVFVQPYTGTESDLLKDPEHRSRIERNARIQAWHRANTELGGVLRKLNDYSESIGKPIHPTHSGN